VGLRGHVDGLSRYAVRGWAADDEQPERPVEVSISLNGAEVTRVVADHPREDLRRLGNLGEGKHGFSYKFTPPIPTTKHCLIVVTYAGTTEILPMGSITLTAKDPEFIAPEVVRHGAQPLLITGHARSGSTIMMRRLVEHPQIAVANLHPYEIKMMAYYSAAYRVLTAQGDRLFSSSPETLESNKFFIGCCFALTLRAAAGGRGTDRRIDAVACCRCGGVISWRGWLKSRCPVGRCRDRRLL